MGFFGKSVGLGGCIMCRYLIVLAAMTGGATMGFGSGIIMLGSLDVVIVGHCFSDMLARGRNAIGAYKSGHS